MRFVFAAAAAVVLAAGAASAQDAAGFMGTWQLDMPGKASIFTETRRVDSSTNEKNTTYRAGASASDVGRLEIRPDGTWRIASVFNGPAQTGRWEANTSGPFSDRGGLELLNVRPDLGPRDRSWFVFVNGDGRIEVREPPYTTYNSYLLKRVGAAPKAAAARAKPATPARPAPAARPAAPAVVAKAAKPAPAAPAARRFTPDEFRAYVIGRTAAQLQAEFGAPLDKGYKSLSFGRLNIVDPRDGAVYRNANIGFDEDGGVANYVYLRE